MHPTVVILAVASLLRGCESVQWTASSPLDGTTFYVCVGDRVTLAWDYTLDSQDHLGNIQWFHKEQMVATSVHGHFFPTQNFVSFLGPVAKAGIILNQVSRADSGNYSVVVHVYGHSEEHFSTTRSVYVQVDGQINTPDGSVHASHSIQAVLDPRTDRFAFQLLCGHFRFHGDPPYMAQWTTPSGQEMKTFTFHDGHFNLLLNIPIQGGNYTCRVPQHRACLNDTQQGMATVFVNKVNARLAILEKENDRLYKSNSVLTNTTSNLLKRVRDLESETIQRMFLHF